MQFQSLLKYGVIVNILLILFSLIGSRETKKKNSIRYNLHNAGTRNRLVRVHVYSITILTSFLKFAVCEIDKQFADGWCIELEFNIPHFCTNREQRKSGRLNGVQIVRRLLNADDLVLFCKSIAEVKTNTDILNDSCSRLFNADVNWLPGSASPHGYSKQPVL